MPDVLSILARGRKQFYGSDTCSIKRSGGDVSGYTTPTAQYSSLKCSRVYPISDEERERAGLTSITRPCRIYVQVPSSGSIKQHDKLVANSREYQVISVKRWPDEDADQYELILDYQR